MDTSASRRNRPRTYRRYTLEEKRRIVAETQEPGVSVASVARRHGMNDNMIFMWRKRFREGAPRMLPVRILSGPVAADRGVIRPMEAAIAGDAQIEVRTAAGDVVRIGAGADQRLVQAVLAALRR